MNVLLKRLAGGVLALALLGGFALRTAAQESAVLRVDITQVAVDTDDNGTVDTVFNPPNEAFGPANQRVEFTAVAEGTFTTESFTYSFFVNGEGIGVSTGPVATDTAGWIPPRPGVYYLTVTATDGATTVTSPTIRYFATGATITSPLPGTLVPVGSSVTIKADATPAQGAVGQIEFFADGVSIGTDSTAPYSLNYTPSAAAGATVNINVVATDSNSGTLTSSNVPITMTNAIGAVPTVTIAAPGDGSVIAVPSAPIGITVTANDADGRIERVEIYVDGVLFATDLTFPYTADWTPVAVGQYRISSLAYDDKNNVVASPVSTVTISAPPAVSITSPSDGFVTSAGATVTLQASASDSDGAVTRVEFYADGEYIGESTGPTYSITWIPATSSGGDPVAVTAVAFDDRGLSTTSGSVGVIVQGSGGSGGGGVVGNPPTVSVSSPANGFQHTVNTSLLLTANASDSDGNVTKVQFYANNTLVGTDDTYPYAAEWTPSSVASFAIEARATDNDGNIVASTAVNVSVVDPSGTPPSVSVSSPSNGASVQVGVAASIIINATDSDGSIQSVSVFVDGSPLGAADATAPYVFEWTPASPGVYSISARATDNSGNQANSTAISVTAADSSSSPPSVAITTPVSGDSIIAGNPVTVAATASDPDGQIASVQIYLDGKPLGGPDLAEPFIGTWTPSSSGTYTLYAVATDGSGNQTTSAAVTVAVVSNGAPTVSLISPTSATSVRQGTPVTLSANAADADGTVASVVFLVNGIIVASSPTVPYTAQWTPSGSGSYSVVARAIDNSGNITNSIPTVVTVAANGSPTVSLDFPGNGSTVLLGNSVELQASASDSGGSIAQVQFYANGTPIGADTAGPFSATWTPNSTGLYRLQATATDNGGLSASSNEITVAVLDASEADSLYSGIFIAGFESGNFTLARLGDRGVIFIGYTDAVSASNLGITPRIYHYVSTSISSGGDFSLVEDGATRISGSADGAAAYGNFTAGSASATFSGALKTGASAGYAGPTGVVYGSLTGSTDSELVALVASDATVTFYIRNGTNEDVSLPGSLTSEGDFTLGTVRGGTLSGSIDPVTGFLTGSLSGSPAAGALTGAASTPTPAADGFLRNLSTRGFVGSGGSVLVGGFVINGSTPKQLLIRAIGPTLGDYGVTGEVSDPQLELYHNGAVIAANDNWGTAGGVPAASTAVGAFTLPSGSKDAALVATLSPGLYSTVVSGVGNASGVGLVEIYDVDNQSPFSAQKVLNLSTRGEVGSGDKTLIAGVNINGTTPKRVLVRAVGPTLADFGVSNPLSDPILRIVRQSDKVTVRENNDWEIGNDPAKVAQVSAEIGAFAIPSGSKDAVLLITLPPGSYSALVTSGDGSTGVAIVEVYEVP